MALKHKKIMPPPWLAFPEIERYSIGWRMGYGEDYIDRFGHWLDTLSPEERTEYRSLFPEPVTWKGWWGRRRHGRGTGARRFHRPGVAAGGPAQVHPPVAPAGVCRRTAAGILPVLGPSARP